MEKEQAVTVMSDLVRVMVRSIVDEPEVVTVEADLRNVECVTLDVHVAPEDVGKVIGKQGRTARAMRLILGASAMACGVPSSLNIIESDR
jgi:predicted RNA-binding protein YlqC (UPF0109 family)